MPAWLQSLDMELPIAKQSYLPSTDALVRAIKRAGVVLARTLTEEEPLESATVFADTARAGVGLACIAADVRVPEGFDAAGAVDEILTTFSRRGLQCETLDSADLIWPEGVGAALESKGYRAVTHHVYVLEGYKPPAKLNPQLQVIPARSLFSVIPAFFAMLAKAEHGADDAAATRYAQALIDQLDEPRLDLFAGRLDGKIMGIAGVVTLGNLGVVYPAFTDPAARGKGVAGTLMDYLIDHCSRAQFERVLLDRVDGCPAIPFYESLGFKSVARYVRYERSRAH